ncbi:MAG: biotin/lipoyl-binding protein [Legionellaceae bacterium]|nr:biotin/lipoyl-binding protein [Legionellaceae bacterium]
MTVLKKSLPGRIFYGEKKQGLIVTAVIRLFGIFSLLYYLNELRNPSTRDAQVYFPVSSLYPQVSGNLRQIFITNNQKVQQGEPLFMIEPMYYDIALRKTEANFEQAKPQVAMQHQQIAIDKATLDAYASRVQNIIIWPYKLP